MRISVLVVLLILAMISLITVYNCNGNSFYDSDHIRSEIEDIISRVIEIDSIEENYPNYVIVSVLPKYVSRKDQDDFVSGPPPNANVLFPDLLTELKEGVQVQLTSKDIEYFEAQEQNSRRLELSEANFSKRKATINIRSEATYIYFTTPILNANHSIAWVKVGIACGSLCGEGRTLVLKKLDGEWYIIKEEIDWIS